MLVKLLKLRLSLT
ncbi:UNVERIFIED_CONTAM: hypothetical protein GTU68_054516 [Idotea baltica]|nr:hypothetical protein [Idotea baltica]